ncbi:MAG: hypothetical protein WC492_02090 [Candidatus Micrarchaeia archaeon]
MFKLSKNDYIKYGTYVLILIFILSTAGIYLGSFGSSSKTQTATPDIISGRAVANATIISWEPSIEVSGDSKELASLVSQLKANGSVTHDIKLSNGRILMLNGSSSIVQISSQIERLGLKPYSDAVLFVGPITIIAENTTTFAGQNFRQKLVPIFEVGDTFEVSFSAQAANSIVYAASSLSIMQSPSFSVQLNAINSSLNSTALVISIPWSERNANYSQFINSLPSGAYANMTSRSFVTFSQVVSNEILQNISSSKPAYITSLQPSVISLNPKYSNESEVKSYFAQFGLNPIFAESSIEINSNSSDPMVLQNISSQFLNLYPNSSAKLSNAYGISLRLPQEFSYAGKNYTLVEPNPIVLISGYPPSEDGIVSLSIIAVGNKVIQYTPEGYYVLPKSVQNSS